MTEHKMAESMSVLEQLRAYPSLKPMLTCNLLSVDYCWVKGGIIAQLRRHWHLPSFSMYFHKGLGSWSRAALFYQTAYLFSTSLPPLHFISNWNHCNYFLSFFFWFISLIRVCSFAPKSSFFINCFLERAVVHEVCLAVIFQTQRPAILSHPLSIS